MNTISRYQNLASCGCLPNAAIFTEAVEVHNPSSQTARNVNNSATGTKFVPQTIGNEIESTLTKLSHHINLTARCNQCNVLFYLNCFALKDYHDQPIDSAAVSIFVVILVELKNTVCVNSTNISTNIETAVLSISPFLYMQTPPSPSSLRGSSLSALVLRGRLLPLPKDLLSSFQNVFKIHNKDFYQTPVLLMLLRLD